MHGMMEDMAGIGGMDEAKGMVYGEIEDFAHGMMVGEAPDYLQNRAKPENIPGDDPSEPGVTFSEEEMGMLEEQYGGQCPAGGKDASNY